ncbi:hypothetical protein EAE99_011667 [Botrytis elliptica]|nr:hypothetical protein EAE99_011667 [Botrytis elliptica]
MSGQDSGDLDWATPSVAQRWGENLTPTRSGTEQKAHHSGAQSRTNEVPDEVPTMIDAPSVSSGNARERFYRDLTRDSWPFPWGQPNNAVHDGTPQTRTLSPTGIASERLSGRRSAENDIIDVFSYLVDFENERSETDITSFRRRRTTRGEHVGEGGSVRGGALARSDEPARGGSHNSGLFTPGGTSQSRGS